MHSYDNIADFVGKTFDQVAIRRLSLRCRDGFAKDDPDGTGLFRQEFGIDDSRRQDRHLGLDGDSGKAFMERPDFAAPRPLPFRENPQDLAALQDPEGLDDGFAVDVAAVDREGVDIAQEPAMRGLRNNSSLAMKWIR